MSSSLGDEIALQTNILARAADQQSNGIVQVKQAINQLEQITLKTAAGAEESASASDEPNEQATSTLHSAQQLQALVSRRSVSLVVASAPTRHRSPGTRDDQRRAA